MSRVERIEEGDKLPCPLKTSEFSAGVLGSGYKSEPIHAHPSHISLSPLSLSLPLSLPPSLTPLSMARLDVAPTVMSVPTSVLLVLLLAFVASVSAQQAYTLDVFDVPQATIALSTAGPASTFNCSPSKASTPTLAGGIRKLQLSAPAGTLTGNSVHLGVFIPSGKTAAPDGVASSNLNLQSPTFQVLYRLDGNTALCSSGSLNRESQYPITKEVNNLNLDLGALGAYAFQFSAMGDVIPNQVTVTMYSPTGATMAQSNPITVVVTGPVPMFSLYTLNFSNTTVWTSGSRFTGTVGAIEMSWAEPANLQFSLNLVQFLINPTSTIKATAYLDCGCDGYRPGTSEQRAAGRMITLSVDGSRCLSPSQTGLSTPATGSVSFSNLPTGCTYTLSVSGPNLCPYTPSSQVVQLGSTGYFAIQGSSGSLSAPASTTVLCGSDTFPASAGMATIASGTCAGATPSFTDTITYPRCTAPGGAIQVISRAWSGDGNVLTQTITVTDRKEISVSSWQPTVIIPCNASPTSAPSPTFTSCTAVGVAVSTQTSTNCTRPGPCTAVTYKATDSCGNTRSLTQYVVQDCSTAPPAPPTCPILDQGTLSISVTHVVLNVYLYACHSFARLVGCPTQHKH